MNKNFFQIITIVSFVLFSITTILFAQASQFTDNGDGTVTDNVTSLMWQKSDDNGMRTWQQALDYCEALTLAGYSNWRLPNIKELYSIVDNTKTNPAINSTYFPGTNFSYYWSSTTSRLGVTYALYVYFYDGAVQDDLKNMQFFVRCVR